MINNTYIKEGLKDFTIATINTLFDGVSVEKRSIRSWIALHAKTFAGILSYVQHEQRLRSGEHPVDQIIKKFDPQVLIINEVIRSPWGSETMSLLDSNNYQHRAIGLPEKPEKTLARNTLIASKLPGTPVKVPISNPIGGHFCAFRIENSNILIIGVQASAFFPRIRYRQIQEIFAFCNQQIQSGLQVVIAGDFNCELTQNNNIHLSQYYFHLTQASFPHPNLLKRINGSPEIVRRLGLFLLSLSGGRQRSLDHILIPSDWKVLSFDREITSSDHLGLIARVSCNNT